MRRRYLPLAAVIGIAVVVLPAMAAETSPMIEAINKPGGGFYGEETHAWSPSTATVSAGGVVTLSNHTAIEHGVHWVGGPETPACSSGVPVGTTSATKGANWSGTCTLTKPGTYTFYCTVHGSEMTDTITVTNGEPTVTTEAATSQTEHEATLHGTVNPNGKLTEYFFKWGTTESYGEQTTVKSAGEGTAGVLVPETLKGLAPGTLYHFKLVAKNEKGPAEGADQTFTTISPPGPPTATTGEATSVGETEAMLKGTVNPDGKLTKSFFEWGTSNSYGQVTAEVPAGEDHADHAASATLMALSPGTVYHFRLVVKNSSSEIVPGVDQTFMTASPPPPLSPPANPSPPTATSSSTTSVLTSAPMAPIELTLGSPLVGAPSLRSSQHGSSVRGSVQISKAGVGGGLEVDLLASGASLAKRGHSAQARVGRLVRSSLYAGNVSFAVPLTAKAKGALKRHRRLALTVKIVLTPLHGAPVSTTRSVVLHA
jgi:plastocyanin